MPGTFSYVTVPFRVTDKAGLILIIFQELGSGYRFDLLMAWMGDMRAEVTNPVSVSAAIRWELQFTKALFCLSCLPDKWLFLYLFSELSVH